jgi:benzoyl-CoA reductase/2-hydroxyglutaryl-CoA dehydratase subunit BcrC/BadD/HgdB
MAKCCGGEGNVKGSGPAAATCGGGPLPSAHDPDGWFSRNVERSMEYARAAKAAGRPVVAIFCEFTPRELILAAGGLPVCMCGGSAQTIPAAEEHLPANLCPLVKSSYGYHVLGNNPLLEMADLVVGETTCDGKKKMYELLAESRPVYVLELPQKADDQSALGYWHRQLCRFREFLERKFAVEISDERIRAAARLLNRERALRRELAGLLASESPPLLGRELIDFRSTISGIPEEIAQYEAALARLRAAPPVADAAARVRVLLTGVPMVRGAERVLEIIEQCGGLVVAAENCTGLKPILEDVDADAPDPIAALAEKYYHLPCSVMTPNDRRLESLRRLAAQYRPECVVELIWQACLTYDVESYRVRRLAEQEWGLSYLRIETDYGPSDSPRIATRVEALLETVRGRRGR